MPQEVWSKHRQYASEISKQDMRNTELVVIMGFFEKIEIALEAVLAFPLLDLGLHGGDICREAELLAIAEPDIVVGVTFEQVYILCF